MKKRILAAAWFWTSLILFFALFNVTYCYFVLENGPVLLGLVLSAILLVMCIAAYRVYDPFSNRYVFKDDTPLIYHKVYCFLCLPLSILFGVIQIISILNSTFSLSLVSVKANHDLSVQK